MIWPCSTHCSRDREARRPRPTPGERKTMTISPAAERFRTARDQLVALREDYSTARSEFVWPDIGGAFNWAIDWFDEIARDNAAPALVILEEDGGRITRTFDELATRSDQLGHWLLGRGVRKGDAVLLMLGNQV